MRIESKYTVGDIVYAICPLNDHPIPGNWAIVRGHLRITKMSAEAGSGNITKIIYECEFVSNYVGFWNYEEERLFPTPNDAFLECDRLNKVKTERNSDD